MLDSAR